MAKPAQHESRQERQTPPAPGERLPGGQNREAQFPDDDEFEDDSDDSEEDVDEDSDTDEPDGTNNSAA